MTKHVQFLELLIGPLANEGGGGGTPATLINKNVSANGTYNASSDNADGYKKVVVAVEPDLQSKSVTIQQNGTTTVSPDSGKDGLSSVGVTVNVQPNLQSKSVTIQQNGTTNVAPDQGKDGLSGVEITVNVSGGGGSANDWAYAFISGGYSGVLTDSADPNVPRITQVILCSMEEETGLTGIDLQNCTLVGASAFKNCTNLVSVNLPVCTAVNNSAFSGCTGLTTANIPLCTTLGDYAFEYMYLMETFNAPALQVIGKQAMNGRKASTGSYYNLHLRLLELPAVTQVKGGCQYLAGLCAVRFGSSVTTLAAGSFRYDSSLDTVIFGQNQASVPTMGDQYVFGSSKIRSGTGYVYVPDSLETTWKAASQWSAISAQIKPLSAITNWATGTYNNPDVVKHGGHYYRCNTDGTTTEPGVDTTNWQDLGAIY